MSQSLPRTSLSLAVIFCVLWPAGFGYPASAHEKGVLTKIAAGGQESHRVGYAARQRRGENVNGI